MIGFGTIGYIFENQIKDKEFVLNNVSLAMKKRDGNKENVLTKRFLNIDAYLKITCGDSNGMRTSIVVTSKLLEYLELPESLLWTAAYNNMRDSFFITDISEVLHQDYLTNQLYVLTTKNNYDGASAIMFVDEFVRFCEHYNLDSCFIIPSSTMELLLVPNNERTSISTSEMAIMVREINSSCVEESIQLPPAIYKFCLAEKSITIVAEA